MSAKKLRTITSVICFLMIFAYVIYLQAVWSSLPERVPIHFDLHGVPNRYGKAPMWPVWILIGGCFGIVIWGIRAMKKAGKDQ